MLATALIFLLGFSIASLLALLFAPVLWRKAQGFARREFDATMPATANEIRAEFDAVRASAAMDVRRQEVSTAEMLRRMGAAQGELGRRNVEIALLKKRERDMETAMAAFAAERDNFREIFAAHRDKERALADTLDEAKRDGSLNAEELEALAIKFREMSELAEGRQIELVAAHTRIERLTDALRSVERASGEKDTLIRLLRNDGERAEDERPSRPIKSKAGLVPGAKKSASGKTGTAKRGSTAQPAAPAVAVLPPILPEGATLRDALMFPAVGEPMTAPQGAEVRERLAEVAANVLYRAALADGPDSPLASLLRAAPAGSADGRAVDLPPSLADRVRRLAADFPQAAASEPAASETRRAE